MIDRKKFLAFENVRKSGVCNMLSSVVRDVTGLSKDEHHDILKNYDTYADTFLSSPPIQ